MLLHIFLLPLTKQEEYFHVFYYSRLYQSNRFNYSIFPGCRIYRKLIKMVKSSSPPLLLKGGVFGLNVIEAVVINHSLEWSEYWIDHYILTAKRLCKIFYHLWISLSGCKCCEMSSCNWPPIYYHKHPQPHQSLKSSS